jgi:phosphonopyruvate decarboxylase
MLSPKAFFDLLGEAGVNFYAGVPDSLLKDFCAYVTDSVSSNSHCITANEGAALALAAGHFLATGHPALVYLQNSGLGNLVNPVTSLVHPDVYSIPALLLIGWRGEPGVKDEPQHVRQGRNMLAMLDVIDIPHAIVPTDVDEARAVVAQACDYMREKQSPFALVVRKGTFEAYKLKTTVLNSCAVSREGAIEAIVNSVPEDALIVSTTGMISRELFEVRSKRQQGFHRDFLTVGSMGHASQIALGIALARPDRSVFCIDGDGALLMHLGSAPILASMNPRNLTHIVLNNNAHDSVGGQPTVGFKTDFVLAAQAFGYPHAERTDSLEGLASALERLKPLDGPKFLEMRVSRGSRSDLGRPTRTPLENRDDFMRFIGSR